MLKKLKEYLSTRDEISFHYLTTTLTVSVNDVFIGKDYIEILLDNGDVSIPADCDMRIQDEIVYFFTPQATKFMPDNGGKENDDD